MRVRKIVNGLRQFGGDQQAFWVNQPEGVGQCVSTRLGLWTGQWFLNVPDGTPWATQVLGRYTEQTRDLAVRARVLGTPGVNKLDAYSSSLDRNSRQWTVSMTVETAYGQIQVSGFLPTVAPPGSGYFTVGESGIGGAPLG